MNIRKVLI